MKLSIKAVKYQHKQIEHTIYVLDLCVFNQESLSKEILYYVPDLRVFLSAPSELDILDNFNKKEDKILFSADLFEYTLNDIAVEVLVFTNIHKNRPYLYRLKGNVDVWHPLSEDLFNYINRG